MAYNSQVMDSTVWSAFLDQYLPYCSSEEGLSQHALQLIADSLRTRIHLAIMREPYLELILEGSKTIESRLTKNRISPYRNAGSGDIVLFKRSGDKIRSAAMIRSVSFHCPSSEAELVSIVQPLRERIRYEDDFIEMKRDARYVSLMELVNVATLPPAKFTKRGRQAWVTMIPAAASEQMHLSWK